jgi:hypothetical protein
MPVAADPERVPRGPLHGFRGGRPVHLFDGQPAPLAALSGGEVADEFSAPASRRKPQKTAKNGRRGPRLSNTGPFPPGTAPISRAAKGATIPEVKQWLAEALAAGQTEFVLMTFLWRRLVGLDDDDRAIARHQAALLHRAQRVLARRGVRNPFVLSVLENTARHGTHGHLVMHCPRALQDEVLSAVEAGLVRRHGALPPSAFNRDGWRHRGSSNTVKAITGAVDYRLKSIVRGEEECGVRRGVGLRPIEGIAVRCSGGRADRPPPQRGRL